MSKCCYAGHLGEPQTGATDTSPGAMRGDAPSQSAAPFGRSLADPLLTRLDRVIPSGPGRWHACCPAHDDHSPSLSVRDDGERVLLHCFAGCDPDDILAAVGLKWSDLYPDRWECAAKRPNEAARKHFRKTFAQIHPLEIDQRVLRIVAADRRAGRPQSVEDRARAGLAVERLRAAREMGGIGQ